MPATISHPDEKTRAQIRAMSAYGLDRDAICLFLSVTDGIIDAHYADDFRLGPIEAEATIRKKLYDKAASGDAYAIKIWLEQNAGGY